MIKIEIFKRNTKGIYMYNYSAGINRRHIKNVQQKGFTLVELSIVLLIIALIITSVLVGQDLIRSAEMRATVRQYENFSSAVGTFRARYDGLPGDIAGYTSYGFGSSGDNGDSDGILEDDDGEQDATELTGEVCYFWNNLGATGAELIAGTYTGADATTSNLNNITPVAESGIGNWGVYAASGVNYFLLGLTTPAAAASLDTADALNPLDAKYIDKKIDDGMPNTGFVNAGIGGAKAYTAPDSACATGTGDTDTYQVDTKTEAATVACTLRFRMSM